MKWTDVTAISPLVFSYKVRSITGGVVRGGAKLNTYQLESFGAGGVNERLPVQQSHYS